MRFDGVAQAAVMRGGPSKLPPSVPPPWSRPSRPTPIEVASAEERFAARLLDVAVVLGSVLALGALRSVGREVIGFPGWATDPLGFLGWPALFAAVIAYDPLCSRFFGASLGKRALGLRIVDPDGTPTGAGRLAIRSATTLVLWLACIVPGMLDGLVLCCDERGRSWHDRGARTLVARAPARPGRAARSGGAVEPPFVLNTPWRDLAAGATDALERYDGAISALAAGAVRDNVVSLRSRFARSVAECHDLAARGDRLTGLLGGAEPTSAALTATLHATAELEGGLRQRVEQVDDASYRAVGIAASAAIATSVDDVAGELAALAAGLSEVRRR